jgi:hypothetical protein
MTQKSRLLLRNKKSKRKPLLFLQSEPLTEKERTLFNFTLTHTDKPLLRENLPTLMTQKSRLLLRNRKSKRKLSPSHQ